jgi:glycerophosphoryl diester phosphodiesterase
MQMPLPPPIIVAHRGLHTRFPENSLAAMRAAWDAGITWCECDVHLSSDGIPFVIHDETLDRTTTARGRIADFPASDLHNIRLRDRSGKPTRHPLPPLADLLAHCGPDRRLLVETKPVLGRRIQPIARAIHKKRGMLQSFHVNDMILASRATSNRCVAILVGGAQNLPKTFPGAIHLHFECMTAPIPRRTVGLWTVNAPADIRRVLGFDIQMLITDAPLQAQRLVRSFAAIAPSRASPSSQKSAG